MELRACEFCQKSFEITNEDLAFYEKIKVPQPKFCPNDRQRRRAACRNERHLFRRKCDATGKEIVSNYSPDKPYPVYDQTYWWGDQWNALDYGRDFDFNRPFFEQFKELQLVVPRLSMYNYNSENSYYTTYSGDNKNCYMCVDLGGCEDIYFSNWITHSKNCIDCSYTYKSELCYQTIYCENCFNCDFCQECENCMDCRFLYDCKGCRDCFGCVGLRNKEYYAWNKPVGKEAYEKFIHEYEYSRAKQEEAWEKFEEFRRSFPHRFALIIDSEDCIGDYIYHSKNAKECFDAVRLWDCKYCYNTLDTKNGYDCYQPGFGDSELIYEIHGGNTLFNCKFTLTSSKNLTDCEYCDQCFYSENLFGCNGVKRGKFCILNKQYAKAEYEKLVSRIKEHMGYNPASARREREAEVRLGLVGSQPNKAELKNKEYGEFFSLSCSPFGYNESKAQEYFPLTKEEAQNVGANWSEYEAPFPQGEMIEPPDDTRQADDSILEKIIACSAGGKPFRLIKQEFDFYCRKKLPLPAISPQKRYEARMRLRRPRHLWNRNCWKCSAAIQTAYAPNRPEQVYCEKCYLETVY